MDTKKIDRHLYSFEVIKEYGGRMYVDKNGRPILVWKHRGKLGLNELYVDFEVVNKFYLLTENTSRMDILKSISKWFVNQEDEISVTRVYETSPDKFPKLEV